MSSPITVNIPQSKSESWAKNIFNISQGIALLLTPVVVAIIGVSVQRTLQTETINRDYVQLAVSILKEKPDDQEPQLRAWAVSLLAKYSPTDVAEDVRKGLASGHIVLPPAQPQPSAALPHVVLTPIGKAFQLAQDIGGFVSQAVDKQPRYGTTPKNMPTDARPTPDFLYKQVLMEYDHSVAEDFHRKFDNRIQSTVPPLETKIFGLSVSRTMEVCKAVSGVREATLCANGIMNDASLRSPD
jgi:hypothetical protein